MTGWSNKLEEIGGHNNGTGDWYWTKPVPFLLHQFVSGQTNFFPNLERTDMSGVFNLSIIQNQEVVTVPLGTYNTVKVTSIFDILPPSPDAGTYVFNAWYAKNIGLIKRIQQDGTIWELKRYGNYTP